MVPPRSPFTLQSDALLRPVRRLLRPLVRLLIQGGVTWPVLADVLRSLYVEVAAHDLLNDPRAQTDSRISLLTGVHRKEIRRWRSETHAPEAVPPVITRTSQIIARWLRADLYVDADGRPRPLPRLPRPEGGPSFESLVQSVTSDVRPRAVLDDWLNHGIVTVDADDRVVLDTAAFVPRPGSAEQLFYFGRNLHDHLSAAAANVTAAEAAPFVERAAHYDNLSPATVARLEALGRQAAQRLLTEFNRQALDLLDTNDRELESAPETPRHRLNLGLYLFVDNDSAGEEP
ncbi:MAG TPA: DUF6502 family protein [Acetobacteraceae bacterium]|jgi:hypothetical protein